MWKVKCDCCGQVTDGKVGEAILPDGWYTIKWTCEGHTHWGEENPDHDQFLLCGNCMKTWRPRLSQTRLDVNIAVDEMREGYTWAKGFGNQGRKAAACIKRALRYLDERIN